MVWRKAIPVKFRSRGSDRGAPKLRLTVLSFSFNGLLTRTVGRTPRYEGHQLSREKDRWVVFNDYGSIGIFVRGAMPII
jgi:hypothetical protein